MCVYLYTPNSIMHNMCTSILIIKLLIVYFVLAGVWL